MAEMDFKPLRLIFVVTSRMDGDAKDYCRGSSWAALANT